MTVDPPADPLGDFPRHFVAKLEYAGKDRYFIFETSRVIDVDDVLPEGEEVISRYLAEQNTVGTIGPVPVCDDEEYMVALARLETGDDDD